MQLSQARPQVAFGTQDLGHLCIAHCWLHLGSCICKRHELGRYILCWSRVLWDLGGIHVEAVKQHVLDCGFVDIVVYLTRHECFPHLSPMCGDAGLGQWIPKTSSDVMAQNARICHPDRGRLRAETLLNEQKKIVRYEREGPEYLRLSTYEE